MSHSQPDAVRDIFDPGWREREAERKRAFLDFFENLPPAAHIRAAVIANQNHTAATVKPIAVVDFYADETENSHDDH